MPIVGSSRLQWGVQARSGGVHDSIVGSLRQKWGEFKTVFLMAAKRFYSRERRWVKGYLFKS
jgi:hypothetical protein